MPRSVCPGDVEPRSLCPLWLGVGRMPPSISFKFCQSGILPFWLALLIKAWFAHTSFEVCQEQHARVSQPEERWPCLMFLSATAAKCSVKKLTPVLRTCWKSWFVSKIECTRKIQLRLRPNADLYWGWGKSSNIWSSESWNASSSLQTVRRYSQKVRVPCGPCCVSPAVHALWPPHTCQPLGVGDLEVQFVSFSFDWVFFF